jgi:Domain of unknown function (DUF6702)
MALDRRVRAREPRGEPSETGESGETGETGETGKTIRLELTEGVDELIAGYLREVFVLRRGQVRGKLHWLGKEVSFQGAWLYFELEISGEPEIPEASARASKKSLELSQTIFFELGSTQVNTVNVRDGETRATLTFHREQPVLAFPGGSSSEGGSAGP